MASVKLGITIDQNIQTEYLAKKIGRMRILIPILRYSSPKNNLLFTYKCQLI